VFRLGRYTGLRGPGLEASKKLAGSLSKFLQGKEAPSEPAA